MRTVRGIETEEQFLFLGKNKGGCWLYKKMFISTWGFIVVKSGILCLSRKIDIL